jgi:hypothetical protein
MANAGTIKKGEGVTAAERYPKRLCDRSFLSLWSYPGLFRDQKGPGGQGKELCDLLVVFEDDIILFSDKDCKFPCTGDTDVDWRRCSNPPFSGQPGNSGVPSVGLETFPNGSCFWIPSAQSRSLS